MPVWYNYPSIFWMVWCWCLKCLSVIVRRVRLVSLRASEAELCSGDAAVHVLDVFALGLKVICCII